MSGSSPDYYAVENTVCVGKYPGEVVSTHASHWEAVAETIRLWRNHERPRRTRRRRISSLRSERDMLEYDLDHSPTIGWHADMLRNYLAHLNAEIARRLAER